MPCSHELRSALSPFMDLYWPGRSLWPEVKPLLHQQDLLQRNLQMMDKLQRKTLEETEDFQTAAPLAPGAPFGLTLDTRGFSPEELSVRQMGSKRLRVSGRTEKKQEDEEGCCSYRYQDFTHEFDLPEDLNPGSITCCLDPDGKLRIQAARGQRVEEAQQSVCSHTEGSRTETHSSTQDKPEHMD